MALDGAVESAAGDCAPTADAAVVRARARQAMPVGLLMEFLRRVGSRDGKRPPVSADSDDARMVASRAREV